MPDNRDVARELLPVADAEVASYERDGAVVIRQAIDGELRGLLEQGVEEAFHAADPRVTRVGSGMAGEGQTTVRDYATQHSPALRRFVDSGIVGEIAATLMRTQSAHLILDQIFYKIGGAIVATPWHQDTPFLRVRGDQLVRLWFPCDSSPRDLTVQVVRGSHRWNVVYRAEGGETAMRGAGAPSIGDHWLPLPPDVRGYPESFDIMRWDVEPGDVLAFQGNMLHGTDGHPGHDRPRRAFAVLLGGPELRFHVSSGKSFPSPGRVRGLRPNDDIPDGRPIGDYPDAFPACWTRGS